MITHLVIGLGEVGQAIFDCLETCYSPKGYDLKKGGELGRCKFLHICIPYSEDFITTVHTYTYEVMPKLVIVHSTVPMGTCRELEKAISIPVVHSPVRGTHPRIVNSLFVFPKHFGGVCAREAANIFKKCNVPVVVHDKSETTEALKLWDTTMYGWMILIEKEIHQWCQDNGLPFDEIYTEPNKEYNAGYIKMGRPEVVRPFLKHIDGPCGGHCIQSNATLLDRQDAGGNFIARKIMSMGQVLNEGEAPLENQVWLYCEYVGKQRSSGDIAKEVGCSDTTVRNKLRKYAIPVRDRGWAESEMAKVKELVEGGMSLKEVADEFDGERTYDSIRNVAYKILDIQSSYDPSIRGVDTRKKISASLQGIELGEWSGFKESVNQLVRKSCDYVKWRDKVFKRDKYACQKCGAKCGGGVVVELHAHHIRGFAQHPKLRFEVNNGTTLCVDCHHREHK